MKISCMLSSPNPPRLIAIVMLNVNSNVNVNHPHLHEHCLPIIPNARLKVHLDVPGKPVIPLFGSSLESTKRDGYRRIFLHLTPIAMTTTQRPTGVSHMVENRAQNLGAQKALSV